MQKEYGYLLYSTANIDRVNLTDGHKEQDFENEARYCAGIVAVLLVNRAQNLHCSSSAITLQAAVHLFSSKDAGKRPLSAAPFTSDRASPLERIQKLSVACDISLRISLNE